MLKVYNYYYLSKNGAYKIIIIISYKADFFLANFNFDIALNCR